MKTTKRVLAYLIVAMMIVAMLPSAFADGYALTITNTTTGHTFSLYQIFTGTLETVDGNKVLSDVKYGESWGSLAGNAVPSDYLDGIMDAATYAETFLAAGGINVYRENIASAAGNTVISGLPAGYYLVKETTDPSSMPDGETNSLYIVQVVDNISIAVKSGTASSEKKVKDHSAQGYTDWQDSADYNIGDSVPFRLTATVGSDYANYKNCYQLTFHDVECDGLTFDKNSVKVFIGDSTTALDNTNYQISTSCSDGCTFEIHFPNLKNIASVQAGTKIHVEYNSVLNANAKIGAEGNPNEMHITFSNNPYVADQKGKTPDDKVIVFTYKVVVNKVKPKSVDPTAPSDPTDPTSNYESLEGAGFTLYKKVGEDTYSIIGEELKGNGMVTFVWEGLDDGDYKLVETTTPAGYNSISDILFTISAEHEKSSDNPQLTSLTGGDLFTGVVRTGQLTADIVNQAGNTLPSTGGMGTTIFYVVGSILVIGAVVLLVSKKRMNTAE